MKLFIKLATYNFYLFLFILLAEKLIDFTAIPNKESIPFSELPLWLSVPASFVLLSCIPVWIWVLIKMFKNKYWFWLLIVFVMPPISFFVTTKHYNV